MMRPLINASLAALALVAFAWPGLASWLPQAGRQHSDLSSLRTEVDVASRANNELVTDFTRTASLLSPEAARAEVLRIHAIEALQAVGTELESLEVAPDEVLAPGLAERRVSVRVRTSAARAAAAADALRTALPQLRVRRVTLDAQHVRVQSTGLLLTIEGAMLVRAPPSSPAS